MIVNTTMPGPPPNVLRATSEFCDALQNSLGDQLVSVIAYGDLAKPGRFDPRASALEVMVVLKEVTSDVLNVLAVPVARTTRRYRLEVLTLTEQDLRSSCDVFPIRFLDMQQHYELLCGQDVLADLNVPEEHLRLRCEQELKNLILRLRNLYLHRVHRTKLLAQTLTAAIDPFVRTLSACLNLKSGVAPTESESVIEAAAAEFGLDRDVLDRVFALKHERRRLRAPEMQQLYCAFMATVEQAADVVDQLDVG